MTIKGDLEAMGIAASDVFDWLTSGDVLFYLDSEISAEDVRGFTRAVDALRAKCAWGKKER